MAEPKPYKLPATVVPERYELSLAPDLSNWTFTGEENISINVQERVREIVLNAAELELQSVELQLADGKVLPGKSRLDAENEQATLSFSETVPAGGHELRIKFSGILNDKLH